MKKQIFQSIIALIFLAALLAVDKLVALAPGLVASMVRLLRPDSLASAKLCYAEQVLL